MTELTSIAISTVVRHFSGQFRTHIIERWSRHRAEQFFDTFVREVGRRLLEEDHPSTPTAFLDRILQGQATSAVLFDAYRRVAISASKDYGPRIVALLVADLMFQGRSASPTDERILWVAESLTDGELLELQRFLEEQLRRAKSDDEEATLDNNGLTVRITSDVKDSNWPTLGVDRSPLDLDDWYGSWAVKLRNLGVLRERVVERSWDYDVDFDRHVDEPGTATEITWSLFVPQDLLRIVEYIRRASTIG